ncbi:unnamed protein product [Cylindrotheca closterium]|uniref:Helicase-associated domain-containing protein n=1 Tax=Cylindrotheca closterium TaxID=2856 RepID=A0AAD2CPR0_9STRA|nr:unnamed protein product [Cylindrotheca closterium]
MDRQTTRSSSPYSQMEGEWILMKRNNRKSKEFKKGSSQHQPSFKDDNLKSTEMLIDSSSAGDDSTMSYIARKPDDRYEDDPFDKTFVMLLLKHLELKDLDDMRQEAIAIIKECGKRKESNEAGYSSTMNSMKMRLMGLVGENHWKGAKALQHLTKLQQEIGSKVGLDNDHLDRCLNLCQKTEQRTAIQDHSNKYVTDFDRKFDLLREHSPNSGHDVPRKCNDKAVKRGWVIRWFRRQYHKKQNGDKSAKITDEQIEQLESIGFRWEKPKHRKSASIVQESKRGGGSSYIKMPAMKGP